MVYRIPDGWDLSRPKRMKQLFDDACQQQTYLYEQHMRQWKMAERQRQAAEQESCRKEAQQRRRSEVISVGRVVFNGAKLAYKYRNEIFQTARLVVQSRRTVRSSATHDAP